MKSKIHHVALNVTELDWYLAFFQNVFGMTIEKAAGKVPERKIWLHEGIQLNEIEVTPVCGQVCDHFSIAVEDIPVTIEKAIKAGCSRVINGPHWFKLPNGVHIELKQLI